MNDGLTTAAEGLIPPHGGMLKHLVPENGEEILHPRQEAVRLPSWDLSSRQIFDVEFLLNGAFSPLDGYLSRADYESVCGRMRLRDGTLWPMPIVLDVTEEFARALGPQDRVALRHPEGMVLAILTLTDVWTPDRGQEAEAVFGTRDETHPGVFQLYHQTNPVYVGKHLSSELGFSKERRDINIRRIGFVASEITKNRGIAVCAPIAPYAATRREVRELISQYGGFIEVYVSTPLEVCEARDRKGLYAKARAGLIKNFTGIDDVYEPPQNPDVMMDTSNMTPEEAAHQILLHLERRGHISSTS